MLVLYKFGNSYQNANGSIVKDKAMAAMLVLYKFGMMSQIRIWKDKQVFIKGFSNSGKTTLATFFKKLYHKSFNVPMEGNGIFVTFVFGDRSPTT